MKATLQRAALAAAILLGASATLAKLPPAPPMDPAKKEAADAKKKADAEKAKEELAAAEERMIQNYRANMKKEGKPIPRPQAVTDASAPAKAGEKKPQSNTAKHARKG